MGGKRLKKRPKPAGPLPPVSVFRNKVAPFKPFWHWLHLCPPGPKPSQTTNPWVACLEKLERGETLQLEFKEAATLLAFCYSFQGGTQPSEGTDRVELAIEANTNDNPELADKLDRMIGALLRDDVFFQRQAEALVLDLQVPGLDTQLRDSLLSLSEKTGQAPIKILSTLIAEKLAPAGFPPKQEPQT